MDAEHQTHAGAHHADGSPGADDASQVTARERHHRVVLEHVLCHAALLIERIRFYGLNLGLLPRPLSEEDPLGALTVSDEDISTILMGFQRIAQTDVSKRHALLREPTLEQRIVASREHLAELLEAPLAHGLCLAELHLSVHDVSLEALEIFIVALAPELDARFGRLFGFLNNDVTRTRPTLSHVQMVLRPWFPGIVARALDDESQPHQAIERLIHYGLLITSEELMPAPLLEVRVPQHIVKIVQSTFEPERSDLEPLTWDALHIPEDAKRALAETLMMELSVPRRGARPLMFLEGAPQSGRGAAARATAAVAGFPIVYRDLTLRHAWSAEALETLFRTCALEARIRSALLVVRSDGSLLRAREHVGVLARLTQALDVPTYVLVGRSELEQLDVSARFVRVDMPRLDAAARRCIWEQALVQRQLQIEPEVLDVLVSRYSLAPGRIHECVEELRSRALWQRDDRIDLAKARATLREMTVRRLQKHASIYRSSATLDDLVHTPRVERHLRALVNRMRHHALVMERWGFSKRAGVSGHGISVLFSGPSGTGKTATAGAVARALEIDLYIVDLSQIMSKWVGETEQNLAQLFDEAESSHVALLFDEADSLFGKRSSEMKSANDRYANLTVNFLLQRIERYAGLVILTTNFEKALDEAFTRRFSAIIHVPAPDEAQRLELWRRLLPGALRYAEGVDLTRLAKHFDMTGAHIRNTLMRAAFLAATRGEREGVLMQRDLMDAAVLEFEDMGRLIPPQHLLNAPRPLVKVS